MVPGAAVRTRPGTRGALGGRRAHDRDLKPPWDAVVPKSPPLLRLWEKTERGGGGMALRALYHSPDSASVGGSL